MKNHLRRFFAMKVNFFLYRSKTNNYGTHPVYCRIRINGTYDAFSTGVFVAEKHWLPKQKRISPDYERSQVLNDTLLRTELELINLFHTIIGNSSAAGGRVFLYGCNYLIQSRV